MINQKLLFLHEACLNAKLFYVHLCFILNKSNNKELFISMPSQKDKIIHIFIYFGHSFVLHDMELNECGVYTWLFIKK